LNEPKPYNVTYSGSTSIVVPKNEYIYTDAFKFGGVNDFAVVYQVACTGIPNVRIQMEQSIDGTNWFTPKGVGDIETTLTSKTLQGQVLTPLCVAYTRFKITEQTDLVTDTVVTMSISLQKKFDN
jgi:hypothetical protein